ncbi:MAG: hypothetical protein O2856_16620, partial [Planctomycetota bacterium]|nr:hypothetical protein [Planctomycetota bacterium]
MPDMLKKLHSSLLSRPFSMVALMAGMALLGAAATMALQSEKHVKSEGNPADPGENTHVDSTSHVAAFNEVGQHSTNNNNSSQQDQPAGADLITEAGVETSGLDSKIGDVHSVDPFSEESLGFAETRQVATQAKVIEQTATKHATPDDSVPSADVDSLKPDDSHGIVDADIQHRIETQPRKTAGVSGITGRESHVTQQAVNLMLIADEQLASGSYVQAMQAYQTIRQKSQGTPGTAVLIRLALCAEAAGRRAAALEAYRKVAATQSDPAWAGVARYGEARCLAAVKQHRGLQTDMLRRVLLDESEFLPTVRNEVLHLIGRDLWQEQSTMASGNLLDDKSLTVPEWTADPARLLDELPLLIHESPTEFGLNQFEVLHFDDTTPDGISVRLSCGTTRLEPLLKNLVIGCQLQLDVSMQAADRLQGRTQQVHINNLRLAILLDGMTIPYDLCWRQNDKQISILHRDELTPEEFRECRLNSAERILRIAVTDGATSRQVGHSRLALATLLCERQRAADAVQFLQVQIETEPRSVVETEAAFNLGKCLMVLNQRNESREAFLRSIDAAGGLTDVKIAAYIFTSRLFLEDNQSKLAISNMMRGVSLSEGTTMEPFAALQLGSAYLIFGNPQGANSVLMEHREKLANGPGREAAAFVSALSRFRAAVLADRREREGWAVVAALAEFKPEHYCGGHWAVLVAEACEELGLDSQSNDAYQLSLKRLSASWLRDRTVIRLAGRYQKDRAFEEARLLLTSMTSVEADRMSLLAKLKSAEV